MDQVTVAAMTCSRIPTDVGEFQLCLYQNGRDDKDHLALVLGDVKGKEDVLVRVHSECFTGDVLGSRRCDCGPQLHRAMQLVAAEGTGVILYLRQEGRGIGLLDKLRAYNLQDAGYDTVDANLMLGHQADERDYTIAAQILNHLEILSLRLLTNNPTKIESLQGLGLAVTDRVPLPPEVNGENVAYLTTKVARMRHLLSLGNGANGHHRQPLSLAEQEQEVKRPFITLSYAQSLDGSITDRRGQPFAISGPESMTMTHKLRRDQDAILVGVGTVLADDPGLTVRLVEGPDPQPVILDSHLRFPLDARLLQNTLSPWILTTASADPARRAKLEAAGARVLPTPANQDGQIDLPVALRLLAEMGVSRLMVEGGARVITSFLAARLVDRLVITIAPLLLGGLRAVNGPIQANDSGFPRLRQPTYQWLGEDMVLSGDVIWDEA